MLYYHRLPSVASTMTFLSTLIQNQMRRKQFVHTACNLYAAGEKGNLAKLRKSTGFSIANCKKALEINNNDLSQAEAWLQSQAQAQGWAKATKLAGRSTTQGLIGVHIEGQTGAIVEVNCETDFVARNNTFRTLVAEVAKECAASIRPLPTGNVQKEFLSQEQLKDLSVSEGRTMGDIVALTIGSVGENLSLGRGLRIATGPQIQMIGYSHPTTPDAEVLAGKFGAILALKSEGELTEIARQLCIHVVGMNPKAVGNISDEKASNPDEETFMVHQEFLSDTSRTVGEVLQEEKLEVVDFVRFECGEKQSNEQ